MIRATAIPGRQRHGTEKNRSAIRKRRAIPRRELSFPVFLFFPRPSFRHSPTGIFNFSPSSAPSPSSGRHPGILCGTLFHFDGALTKPVEILRKQLLLQEISLNKSARFRKHIIPTLHQKEISHAGSHCKTRNHPFSGYYTRDSEDCKDSPETVSGTDRQSGYGTLQKENGPEFLRSISENRPGFSPEDSGRMPEPGSLTNQFVCEDRMSVPRVVEFQDR